MPDTQPLLTPKDVALRIGVSATHVSRLARDGWLPYTLTPGKHRRFRLEDVEQLERELAESKAAS